MGINAFGLDENGEPRGPISTNASRPSPCVACDAPIHPGQKITLGPKGWLCEPCAPTVAHWTPPNDLRRTIAREAAPCLNCRHPIEPGDVIVRGPEGWICEPCGRGQDDTLTSSSMRATARHPSTCPICKTDIKHGDPIALGTFAWVCATCYDTGAAARKWLPFKAGARRTDPAYAHSCPTCNAQPTQSCLTASGKPRPLHPTRRRLTA